MLLVLSQGNAAQGPAPASYAPPSFLLLLPPPFPGLSFSSPSSTPPPPHGSVTYAPSELKIPRQEALLLATSSCTQRSMPMRHADCFKIRHDAPAKAAPSLTCWYYGIDEAVLRCLFGLVVARGKGGAALIEFTSNRLCFFLCVCVSCPALPICQFY
ncbi:hypothetical protein GQ53DRAFT_182641 [Thozetella sp. PMI_491]|nr:hypothetical protein GQ53DRAFT_182641 [Thozetella sp. PMI_491]